MDQIKGRRGRPKKDKTAQLISFRLSPEVVAKLKRMCKYERDDTGAPISYTAYARRVLIQALENAE
jgi:hypothetical protein